MNCRYTLHFLFSGVVTNFSNRFYIYMYLKIITNEVTVRNLSLKKYLFSYIKMK